jgi:hypothetical protein
MMRQLPPFKYVATACRCASMPSPLLPYPVKYPLFERRVLYSWLFLWFGSVTSVQPGFRAHSALAGRSVSVTFGRALGREHSCRARCRCPVAATTRTLTAPGSPGRRARSSFVTAGCMVPASDSMRPCWCSISPASWCALRRRCPALKGVAGPQKGARCCRPVARRVVLDVRWCDEYLTHVSRRWPRRGCPATSFGSFSSPREPFSWAAFIWGVRVLSSRRGYSPMF